MASNPRRPQPLSVWRDSFRGWMGAPSPDALMHAAIFFDVRPVCGAANLFEALGVGGVLLELDRYH